MKKNGLVFTVKNGEARTADVASRRWTSRIYPALSPALLIAPFCKAAGAIVVALTLTFSAGCATVPRDGAEANWMEYLETQRSIESEGTPFAAGSEEERRSVERFQKLLSDFKAPDFEEQIREVYAEDAFFNDTLKTVRGVDAIEEYLVATAEAVERGTVEFLDVVGGNGNYYFRWSMTIRFKQIARGEDKRSVGMTHVRFDSEGKVLLHQDFWDSTGGLFEHVPMLGWILRRAKERL